MKNRLTANCSLSGIGDVRVRGHRKILPIPCPIPNANAMKTTRITIFAAVSTF